jgi:predicted DNA-binding transcriptional regulator AlpA
MKKSDDYLTQSQVLDIIPLPVSLSAFYRMLDDKEFPQPIRIGKRKYFWPRAEVLEWVEARLKDRGRPTPIKRSVTKPKRVKK